MKLSAIKEPRFEIELPSGEKRDYDPWEVTEALEALNKAATPPGEPSPSAAEVFDNVRKAFGFPTKSEYEAAEEPKPLTLTRHQCMVVQAALLEFTSGLDVSKKLSGLMQSLPASTASASPR